MALCVAVGWPFYGRGQGKVRGAESGGTRTAGTRKRSQPEKAAPRKLKLQISAYILRLVLLSFACAAFCLDWRLRPQAAVPILP